jgi:pimeloyl-ACP methyl ester carboxylesterase
MEIHYKSTRIYFTDTGKGNAIVLLHGFLENLSMWESIVPQLSKKNRVICVDLLGHGNTENLGYIHTMADQALAVKAVLDFLRLRRYILIGHSMGGYISLEFASLFPENVKGLCLMNSSALPDSDEKIANRNRAILAVKQNSKTFVRLAIPNLFAEKNKSKFTSEIDSITIEALKMSTQGIIAALEGMKIRKDKTKIYKTAKFPIKLIIGREDPALDYNSLIEQSKNTKVITVTFPDGHMSHIENKNELIQVLQNFVKQCC